MELHTHRATFITLPACALCAHARVRVRNARARARAHAHACVRRVHAHACARMHVRVCVRMGMHLFVRVCVHMGPQARACAFVRGCARLCACSRLLVHVRHWRQLVLYVFVLARQAFCLGRLNFLREGMCCGENCRR